MRSDAWHLVDALADDSVETIARRLRETARDHFITAARSRGEPAEPRDFHSQALRLGSLGPDALRGALR